MLQESRERVRISVPMLTAELNPSPRWTGGSELLPCTFQWRKRWKTRSIVSTFLLL